MVLDTVIQVEPYQTFCVQSHLVLRDYSDIAHFSYEDPVRLGMQIAFGRVRRKTAPTGAGINEFKDRKIAIAFFAGL